jgi:hypothetical protein
MTRAATSTSASHPQEVLLQGPNEALGAAISLGGPHEGGRALHVQEGKLLLEGRRRRNKWDTLVQLRRD